MVDKANVKNVVIVLFEDYNKDPRIQKQIKSLINNNYNIFIFMRRYYERNSKLLPIVFDNNNIHLNLKDISSIKFPVVNIILQLIENIRVGFAIRKLENINIIQSSNTRAWLTGYIAKRKSTKLIYDSYELVPENVSGIRKLYWGILVKCLIKAPDYIIHAEANRAKYFENKYKMNNVIVIENYPYKNNSEIVHYISNNCTRLVYAGSILKDRGYEELIKSIKNINDKIILDFWGRGPIDYVESLKNMLKSLKIENVRFRGEYKINEFYNILINYDIGLLFYKSSNLNQYFCAPNKLFEYMQVGIPVITYNTPSISPIIELNKIGICINEITSQELETAIKEIIVNNYKNNYSSTIRSKYNWESIESKYLNIYKSLI